MCGPIFEVHFQQRIPNQTLPRVDICRQRLCPNMGSCLIKRTTTPFLCARKGQLTVVVLPLERRHIQSINRVAQLRVGKAWSCDQMSCLQDDEDEKKSKIFLRKQQLSLMIPLSRSETGSGKTQYLLGRDP